MKKGLLLLLTAVLLCTACRVAAPTAETSEQTDAPQREAETDRAPVEAEVLVNRIDGLSEGFLMGADVSSLLSLENSGVRFYGFDGVEQDPLLTLQQAGVNCIRVRVWVDPFDADGNGYGGGNCDIETAVALGKRCMRYGLRLFVDFHYSDFWADPSKQQAPKAWAGFSYEEKAAALRDYTEACLTRLSDAGADVFMVQIGNETTNGFCGETDWPKLYGLLATGAAAVRAFDPSIRIAVHFTNPESGKYKNTAFLLDHFQVDYDVFASSYYPYWHGTLENLTRELSDIAETYGKQVMVAETSWAYTLEDGDGHGNTIGEKPTYDKPYPFTVQGQATELSAVIAAVASMGEAGLGVCYWEPAWIPVPAENDAARALLWAKYGSGWASVYAAAYDPNDAGAYYGGCACENQALFDGTGHPLPSLSTFRYVYTGTVCPVRADAVENAYVTVRQNNVPSLPNTVRVVYNDGTTAEAPVTWDVKDVPSGAELGTFPVSGMAENMAVVCYVSVIEENYIDNFSFEDADRSMWKLTDVASGIQTDYQTKKTDAYSGSVALHFWNANAVEWRVEQTVDGLKAGAYRLSVQVQGGDVGDAAEMYLYAMADGVVYRQDFTVSGWVNWQQPIIDGILCQSGTIIVGVYVRCAGGGWGTLDDFLLNPVNE